MNEEIQEMYSDTEYDIEAMLIDIQNNNFDPETGDAEAYRHEEIVRTSIINGQLKQAENQAREFGLDYQSILTEEKG